MPGDAEWEETSTGAAFRKSARGEVHLANGRPRACPETSESVTQRRLIRGDNGRRRPEPDRAEPRITAYKRCQIARVEPRMMAANGKK